MFPSFRRSLFARFLKAASLCAAYGFFILLPFLVNIRLLPGPSLSAQTQDDDASTSPPAAQGGLLSLADSALSFGTVPRGGSHEIAFQLENRQGATIELDEIQTSCECFQITLAKKAIAAGERVQATARVDFSEEPRFTGSLALEAKGFTKQAKQVAFILSCKVLVQ